MNEEYRQLQNLWDELVQLNREGCISDESLIKAYNTIMDYKSKELNSYNWYEDLGGHNKHEYDKYAKLDFNLDEELNQAFVEPAHTHIRLEFSDLSKFSSIADSFRHTEDLYIWEDFNRSLLIQVDRQAKRYTDDSHVATTIRLYRVALEGDSLLETREITVDSNMLNIVKSLWEWDSTRED